MSSGSVCNDAYVSDQRIVQCWYKAAPGFLVHATPPISTVGILRRSPLHKNVGEKRRIIPVRKTKIIIATNVWACQHLCRSFHRPHHGGKSIFVHYIYTERYILPYINRSQKSRCVWDWWTRQHNNPQKYIHTHNTHTDIVLTPCV